MSDHRTSALYYQSRTRSDHGAPAYLPFDNSHLLRSLHYNLPHPNHICVHPIDIENSLRMTHSMEGSTMTHRLQGHQTSDEIAHVRS